MHLEIEKKFTEAVKNNKLTFTESTQERQTLDNGLQLAITLASGLSSKPESTTSGDGAGKSDASPWLPIDGDLLVKEQDTHSVVLNKFPVVKNHVLLVTNEFKNQSLPLTEDDWKSSLALLKQLNEGTGTRHIGFYNSGSQSGASVSHKHIQFMPLPESFSPFPDTTKDAKPVGMYGDERVPFAHYITQIPDANDFEEATLRYSDVLGRAMTMTYKSVDLKERPEFCYNMVFTDKWIMTVPRTKAKTEDGISVNALATIGLLLAKNDDQFKALQERGFEVVKECGYPFEEVKVYQPDFTGFTLY